MKHFSLTNFVKDRLFDPNKGGTYISDCSPHLFEETINDIFSRVRGVTVLPGYAPFCTLYVFENWTNARVGTLPITQDNRHLLRSDYISRNEQELPVLVRWLEMLNVPVADYLVVIAYTAEQLLKEGTPIDARMGVVAVLGQMTPEEEPMSPITAMRNALGVSEGGSGVPLDREAYLKSVAFWRDNAIVKRAKI